MRCTTAFVCIAQIALWAGGCLEPGATLVGAPETIQQGITGNVASEAGFPAVGILASGTARCTATLIGKRSVLTAGHCIKTSVVQFELCPGYATCPSGAGTVYDSAQTTVFPAYQGSNTNDLALVILDRDAQGVSPAPINTQPLSVGQAITIVGYGNPGFGTKRSGANTVSQVASTSFKFADLPNVDSGDSGGPTFVDVNGEPAVAGVHSTKGTLGGTDGRVDAFQTWISDVTGGDVTFPGGATTPPPVVPGAEGESCYSRGCAAGLGCVTVYTDSTHTNEVGRFCMEHCTSAGAGDPACDGSEQCTNSASAGLVCFATDAAGQGFTNRQPGDDPSSNPAPSNPAPSNPPPTNEPPAPTPSDPTPSDPAPSDPAPSDPAPSDPVAPPSAPVAGAYGASCSGPSDCDSGVCANDGGENYCTETCTPGIDACPKGTECLSTEAQSTSVCAAPTAQSGFAPDGDRALQGGCILGGGDLQRGRGDLALALLALLLCAGRRRFRRSARALPLLAVALVLLPACGGALNGGEKRRRVIRIVDGGDQSQNPGQVPAPAASGDPNGTTSEPGATLPSGPGATPPTGGTPGDTTPSDPATPTPPAASDLPPAAAPDVAVEGEPCAGKSCDQGLACVTVYTTGYSAVVGQYCMEQCATPGGADPTCDGGEVCTNSKSAGPVCYNSANAQQGYTSPGQVAPVAPPPAGTCGDAVESEVFNLVNQLRAQNGLAALSCDPTAGQVAHDYSATMCSVGFFSHTGADGSSPFERMEGAGISYFTAGENIAKGQSTAQEVMNSWMNSSGHRANILRANFTHLGVGYAPCGGRPLWTQDFFGR